jgi:hypothetical protein
MMERNRHERNVIEVICEAADGFVGHGAQETNRRISILGR